MTTSARFTIYGVLTRGLGGVPTGGSRLLVIPSAHVRGDDDAVAGVVRLGLPAGVTVEQRTTDDSPIEGSYGVYWDGEEAIVSVDGGVPGRYTLRRQWDGATIDLPRLAVLA